jgi:dTDP-4-dehydrorhamnose reductase
LFFALMTPLRIAGKVIFAYLYLWNTPAFWQACQYSMRRHIIVSGSNGLLGQKIINLLVERPYMRVYAASRGVNRHPIRDGYAFHSLDLEDEIAWRDLFEEVRPTELIHTAAMTQVDHCEAEPDLCDAVNVFAVQRLVELCRDFGTRLIYISTDFVFDGENGPYGEEDPTGPVNYYGQSKLRAEELITRSGINACILRTVLLYGVTPAMSRSNIVLWTLKNLKAGKPIRVVEDQFRCPTLVEDLAAATVSAIMRNASGLYHICGPEMYAIVDIAREVADHWGLDSGLITPVSSVELNERGKRPPKTGFVTLNAQTDLGFKPHSLRQGLEVIERQMEESWTD